MILLLARTQPQSSPPFIGACSALTHDVRDLFTAAFPHGVTACVTMCNTIHTRVFIEILQQ